MLTTEISERDCLGVQYAPVHGAGYSPDPRQPLYIHWFNPLSWVFLKYFFADMELVCDAKVIKSLNERQTKEYALALLTCASGKAFFASAFGGTKTKLRIETILSYKKLTLFSSLCFAVLLISLAFISSKLSKILAVLPLPFICLFYINLRIYIRHPRLF